MYFLIFICTFIYIHRDMQVSLTGCTWELPNSVTIGLKLCINGMLC